MNQQVLEAKQNVVNEIVSKAKDCKTVVVAEYRGLTVAQLQEIRRALRKEGASLFVYKNSMVERASEELGWSSLSEILCGPNAFVFCEGVSNGAKVVAKYARRYSDSLKIKGGVVEGTVVDAKKMVEVSKLPGKEGLISMFLSCLQAPVRQFACTVQAVADAK